MTEFDRKVEEASARINRSVANIAETLEKETAELVTYLNDEVVPSGANAFLEGAAHGGGKALQVRGLSGNTAQEFLSCLLSNSRPGTRGVASLAALPACLHLLLCWAARASERLRAQATQAQVPPPPSLPQENRPRLRRLRGETGPRDEKIDVPANAKPIFEETGMASWYGAPYHNRRGSNGEVYDMHAMTAAHLTLPLGSIVRVTNLKTGHSALVRITDRGPFVPWGASSIFRWPPPRRWMCTCPALQGSPGSAAGARASRYGWTLGGSDRLLHRAEKAAELAEHLQKRYQTAKVLKFVESRGSWWVRVRVLDDDRQRAFALARETETWRDRCFWCGSTENVLRKLS
jgi:rare lipoprotein A